MLVNTAIMSDVFIISLWNFFRLALMSGIFFYWIPRHLFPQTMIHNTMDKIMFNIVYMIAFVLLSVPILIQFHIFSMPLFLLLLLLSKALFVRLVEKKSFFDHMVYHFRILFIKSLDILDNLYYIWKHPSRRHSFDFFEKFHITSFVVVTRWALTWMLFAYITYTLALGGFISYADALPDVAQFVEWVASLNNNILFADNKTFGADFYGQATIIFFFQKITNIDSIVLFNIYPALLVLFVLFGLYYVVFKVTDSPYSAIFSIALFGILFLSPAADVFLGRLDSSDTPPLVEFSGLRFYLSWIGDYAPEYIRKHLTSIAHVPYERYAGGLAYEFASSFFLLNVYFMGMWAMTKKSGYLLLYGLTVYLMFTFHGGGAIYAVAADLFVFAMAIVYGKVSWKMFGLGVSVVVIVSVLGNLWILSMFKYGLPQDFGAAAPFLDNLFSTKKSIDNVSDGGEIVQFAVVNLYQMSVVFMMLSLPIVAILTRQRFTFIVLSMSVVAVIIIYFMPNLGLPRLAKQSRIAEYLLLVFAAGGGMYYSLFISRPFRHLHKSYTRHTVLAVTVVAVMVLISLTPRWIDSNRFMQQTNAIEYNDLALQLYKISREHRPYTWTTVAYVQSYPKVLGKGFHLNSQNFLFQHDPHKKYLEIPSVEWVYIFIENVPNKYEGMDEWYYRWRSDIQEQMKSWIESYMISHDNISIQYESSLVTVYKIDNRVFLEYDHQMSKRRGGF